LSENGAAGTDEANLWHGKLQLKTGLFLSLLFPIGNFFHINRQLFRDSSRKPTMTRDLKDEREALIISQGEFLIERHIATAMSAAHWHNHVEVNLLLEGQMTYLFNGRREQVEAGRLVLFWAAIPHQTIAVTTDVPLICIYLPLADFLALSIDRNARQSVMQGRFLTEMCAQPTNVIVLPQWVEEWRRGDPVRRQLIVDEVRLRVRRLILDAMDGNGSAAGTSLATAAGPAVCRAETITALINIHYARPLSVPGLAKLAGIHPSTANKAFRDVLGISVNEYVTRYRLARAMHRLADTEDSIIQIAYDCGFASSSRFYDLFKQRTGTTPKLFRTSSTRT
jgi:AraC-like DNA-binding protein